ncbi:MAG: adenylate/guanylate cyclase domain-containing protein [Chromatiales bacterium]|jgi:class 3 adenylate cyclase|nr:adenylate/guanylate cyclase domain-containing protein [Chromatiales bacterium]MDH4031945.1 adenylate/guanylate cyclase domain-containing protein [Chromatiales bacterium]
MANETEVAVLFADVVGSTELYEALGDIKARDTIAHCLDAMKTATEQHSGRVIKTIGDEVMSTFPTADDALNAAREMQINITRGPLASAEGVPLAIRVGCDFGPVVPDERDVFGSTVHTANRMTSQAKASQIVTTSDMVEHLSAEWRASVRQIDLAHVKGKSGEIALYEVLWQKDDITSMLPTISWGDEQRKPTTRMRLRYQGDEVTVDAAHPLVRIGRSEDNELVIKGNLISRLHCRVEISRDRFSLVDQSTNGTFVITRQGEELFVRRDSIQLSGEGVIGLGRVVQAGSAQAIHFIQED